MFRFPYRWRFDTIHKNLGSACYDIRHGIYNILRWTPVIWFDLDCDWTFLNEILEYKFRRMAKSIGDEGHLVRSARYGRQLTVCAELCKRMREDKYAENASRTFPDRGTDWAKSIRRSKDQDNRYLGLLIGKYYRHWWD
jgi:hypothetical protein